MTDEERKALTVVSPHYAHIPVAEGLWFDCSMGRSRFVDDDGKELISVAEQRLTGAPHVEIRARGGWITIWVGGEQWSCEQMITANQLAALLARCGCEVTIRG